MSCVSCKCQLNINAADLGIYRSASDTEAVGLLGAPRLLVGFSKNTTYPTATHSHFLFKVIDLGGEPIKATEYCGLGLVTEFKYGTMLGSVIRKWNQGKLSDLKYDLACLPNGTIFAI